MIYHFIKCESVIAKIMSDAAIAEKDLRITDMREWVFEAVEKIGSPMQYVRRESGIDGVPLLGVRDHQAPLPQDIVRLQGLLWGPKEDGPWVSVEYSRKMFFGRAGDISVQKRPPKVVNIHDVSNYAADATHLEDDDRRIKNAPVTESRSSHPQPSVYSSGTVVTFFLKPSWIVLSEPSGFLRIRYVALALDERGYPLIPDVQSYQEAVYWYVLMKLNFSKFLKGSLGGKARYNQSIYQYLEGRWLFYRNQAYAETLLPSEPEMKGIGRAWNRLVPEIENIDD